MSGASPARVVLMPTLLSFVSPVTMKLVTWRLSFFRVYSHQSDNANYPVTRESPFVICSFRKSCHIEAWSTKWLIFCRCHFQMHFLEQKISNSHLKFHCPTQMPNHNPNKWPMWSQHIHHWHIYQICTEQHPMLCLRTMFMTRADKHYATPSTKPMMTQFKNSCMSYIVLLVLNVCITELGLIGLDNGLLPASHNTIILTNDAFSSITPQGTVLNEKLSKLTNFQWRNCTIINCSFTAISSSGSWVVQTIASVVLTNNCSQLGQVNIMPRGSWKTWLQTRIVLTPYTQG